MTPDKGHRKNLVTSYPLQKDPIHWRGNSKPHGSKPFYSVSDHSFTESSHDEENIENYKYIDELYSKDKEYAEDWKERCTLIKTLVKLNFKKNIIWYILTNIFLLIKNQWSKERWFED